MKKLLLSFIVALLAITSVHAADTPNILDKAFYPTTYGTSGQCWVSGGNGVAPNWSSCGAGGGGTVTTVSVTTANGVSGTVANATTTPAITLTLGAITPTSVSTGALTSSALTTGRIPIVGTAGLLADSANLLFSTTSGPIATIGNGSTTAAGWQIGYGQATNFSAIYITGITPGTTNYTFGASSLSTFINAPSGGSIFNRINNVDKFTINGAAGQGPTVSSGTAVAAGVPALQVTRTNNNALVDTGVQFVFTDTTSAAGFLPFQILGGSAGASVLFVVDKNGAVSSASNMAGVFLRATSGFQLGVRSFALATAPTLASGGCTGAAMSGTQNGTAYFRAGVGTGCTLSQPLVFTLPAASSGWNCTARNVSNGATSAPAQTGAESTTSVTITNFVRATGVAGAWTDSDVIVVSCLGG